MKTVRVLRCRRCQGWGRGFSAAFQLRVAVGLVALVYWQDYPDAARDSLLLKLTCRWRRDSRCMCEQKQDKKKKKRPRTLLSLPPN